MAKYGNLRYTRHARLSCQLRYVLMVYHLPHPATSESPLGLNSSISISFQLTSVLDVLDSHVFLKAIPCKTWHEVILGLNVNA